MYVFTKDLDSRGIAQPMNALKLRYFMAVCTDYGVVAYGVVAHSGSVICATT